MRTMQEEMQAFVGYVQKEFLERSGKQPEGIQNALVRISPPRIVRTRGKG